MLVMAVLEIVAQVMVVLVGEGPKQIICRILLVWDVTCNV